jgi:hypothetical protein
MGLSLHIIREELMQPARKHEPEAKSSIQEVNQVANANIIGGSLWMVGISLVLFFLPAINGLVGGLVGGYKVGTPRNALIAAILPAVVIGIGLVLFFNVLGFPVLAFFAGITIASLVALSEVGLLVGAWIGGFIRAQKSR